jgi:hypothetical protein
MPTNGFLHVRVFTSAAQLPVENATVTVTQSSANGARLIASRITDESGLIAPIPIPAPDRVQSLQAGNATPFTSVDIIADHPDFERVLVENAQIFAGVQTEQEISLIPYEERPNAWNLTETFQVTAQPL